MTIKNLFNDIYLKQIKTNIRKIKKFKNDSNDEILKLFKLNTLEFCEKIIYFVKLNAFLYTYF